MPLVQITEKTGLARRLRALGWLDDGHGIWTKDGARVFRMQTDRTKLITFPDGHPAIDELRKEGVLK